MPPPERRATISTYATRTTRDGLGTPKHPEAVPALAH
jgi:hypothetical protein